MSGGSMGAALRRAVAGVLCSIALAGMAQTTASRNLAPGFTALPPEAKVMVAPLDVELFELSAGGVMVPRADWTEAANRHMGQALQRKAAALGVTAQPLASSVADEQAELLQLHAAVARALSMHHVGALKLPTKEERLDWSFGEVLQPLRDASGARYALFTWMRDSYATAERKAMMVGLALLGVGITGGFQVGYATLVDLETGQVLWFNQVISGMGDLRDEQSAAASVDSLLASFPGSAATRP